MTTLDLPASVTAIAGTGDTIAIAVDRGGSAEVLVYHPVSPRDARGLGEPDLQLDCGRCPVTALEAATTGDAESTDVVIVTATREALDCFHVGRALRSEDNGVWRLLLSSPIERYDEQNNGYCGSVNFVYSRGRDMATR